LEPGGQQHKLAHLDGLRGLAAVVVVIHHMACAFAPAAVFGSAIAAHFAIERTVYQTPLQLLVAGNFAVCIFFALSGYVLSHKFFVKRDWRIARAGAVKRYFRLMPPILASVLLAYAVLKLGLAEHLPASRISGSQIWLAKLWPGAGLAEAVRQGVYGALTGRADTTLFNNVLWTMKVEFFGSFLVFAFLALFGLMKQRWIMYLALVILLWNTYYLAFIIGMALCDINVNRPNWRISWPVLALAMGLGLFLGAAPLINDTPTIYSQFYIPFLPSADMFILPHVIGAGLVLLAVVFSARLKQGLGIRPLRYLGKISFSMYLLHVIIIGTLTSWLLVLLAPHMSYLQAVLGAVAISVPAILIASHYFTRFVDGPSVKLASRINSNLVE
jgi:peptidoglycan/LPS O-acetylase OafA/YrhL